MEAIAFRTGEMGDVDALLALVHSSYRGDESREGWTTEADLLDGQRTDVAELTEILGADTSRLIVAELADGPGPALVGCCHVESHEAGVAHLGMFAVRPDRQGRGIGRAIVAEAERVAGEQWEAEVMTMLVIRQRRDILGWYERLGYVPTGAVAAFPYGDERFGVPRREDLEFVVIAKSLRR